MKLEAEELFEPVVGDNIVVLGLGEDMLRVGPDIDAGTLDLFAHPPLVGVDTGSGLEG